MSKRVGNLLQKQSKYTITFKKWWAHTQVRKHIISWRKQSVLNCSVPFHAWNKSHSFINCNFPSKQSITSFKIRPGFKKFPQNLESWILNPGKFAKFAFFFWEVSACVHLYVFASFCWFNTYAYVYAYVFIWMYIYIYIYGPPFTINCSIIIPNHKTGQKWWIFWGGTIYIYIYIYIYPLSSLDPHPQVGFPSSLFGLATRVLFDTRGHVHWSPASNPRSIEVEATK